jgi:biotin carboxyl carrier protein
MTNQDSNLNLAVPQGKRRRSSLPILVLAVLFVSATFLTWYYTWFGRDLTDSELSQYLADEKHPRHVQHALLQIQQRLEQNKPVQQWYPRIVELAVNPETEFRMTSAWLMGYDNKSEEFHRTLLRLLADQEPMVSRNAALALVRFNDSQGREALLATLRPYPVIAADTGVVNSTLSEGSAVSRGTLLARVLEANGTLLEVRSPIPGKIEKIVAANGGAISSGNTILTINSDANSIWEALRGLALIGRAEDLSEIERYAKGVDSLPERIKQQAALTAKAIQSRTVLNAGKG